MYFELPQLPDAVDLELAAAFTHTAAIIIWRPLQSPQIQPSSPLVASR
ncbi:hypothetical protein [Pseudomonas oryzihabitans]|nr:hypothetical protein [Pseudomonas oryzihabitans]MDT3717936.1 hypothetical protein [Pseudomonas oryzihabitans]